MLSTTLRIKAGSHTLVHWNGNESCVCIGIEPAMNWVLEHMGDPGIEIGIFNTLMWQKSY